MGKNHSKFGLSLAGKKRENPEGGTYVLNGCVNGRFRNSEECVWSNAATSGSPARFALPLSPAVRTPENLKTCQCENEQSPVGFAEDNCRFEVALPPEVTGSACSVKVYAMEERDSVCKPPLSPSNGKLPSGAVDYNVSLDRESDQQEWSFTLYDFDGHRRVTREDLSSVLKSISEALSTTVTLPPCGSKKLHLRLSVMPDKETKKDQEKVQKKAITPVEGKDTNGTQVVVPDSKQTQTKTEQTITPAVGCAVPTTHVHRRHHHHHHGRRDGVRSSKRHSRSQPTNQGDAGNLEIKSPDKRHSRLRKHQSSHHGNGAKAAAEPTATIPVSAAAAAASAIPAETTVATATAKHHGSNTTKEPSTPETPCTVLVNELTTENLANHDNQDRKSDENRERRSYYQELAGIENTCGKKEEPDVLTPAQVLKFKHSGERTKSKHHRNGHQQGGSPHHRRSKVYEIDIPVDQLERTAKYTEKPKGAADYHTNLLEASRAKLENQQPVVPVTTPLTPPENGIDIGTVVMHRKEQRRRHHHNGTKSKRPTTLQPAALQPFMLFEHELTSNRDRQVYTSPTQATLHRHDHHHHHEHHHHYHYHHYHT